MLTSVPPESVLESVGGRSFCFLSAVSFEERATAWAEFMASREAQPDKVFLVDYETTALPVDCRPLTAEAKSCCFLQGVRTVADASLRSRECLRRELT